MRYYGLQEAVRRRLIFPNATDHIKQYTVVFANGEMMVSCYAFFKHKEIAEKLDVDKRQISMWAKNFCERGGVDGFVKKRGGRFNENMSLEEETQILKQFKFIKYYFAFSSVFF